MADTVFGKIVRGEIPCNKVYEDEQVLAFLDINPLSAGHTLVVPKEPAETLDRLSDESAAALGRVLPRLCRAVVAATGVKEYNQKDRRINLLSSRGAAPGPRHSLRAAERPHGLPGGAPRESPSARATFAIAARNVRL